MRQWLTWLASTALAALPAAAQLPDDLEVGTYVEVDGRLASGALVAEKVEVRAVAKPESRVRGVLQALDARTRSLAVAGVTLVLEAGVRPTDAYGRDLELATLAPGLSVEARGSYRDGTLHARSVSVGAGDASRPSRLVGPIGGVDADADAFRLLGVGVRVTPATSIELD